MTSPKTNKQLEQENSKGKKKHRVAEVNEHEAELDIKDYLEHESDYLRVEDN